MADDTSIKFTDEGCIAIRASTLPAGGDAFDVRIAVTEESLAEVTLTPSEEGDILPDDSEPGDETD